MGASAIIGESTFPVVDGSLARRLERVEAMANAASVEARRREQPHVGADWTDVAGVYAMFDGPDSPLTQTFGLGLFEPFGTREFDRVEEFFTQRGAATAHEACSFLPPETLALLGARGYVPIEASTVLVRPIDAATSYEAGPLSVRPIESTEAAIWSRVAARGWESEVPGLREFLENMGVIVANAAGATCFVAERDGEPIAAAALNLQSDVALFAGASTVPASRRQGAQRELFRARLAFAAARGITLAMVVTQPGSASQRNAIRQGFRPIYSRTKWQRALDAR